MAEQVNTSEKNMFDTPILYLVFNRPDVVDSTFRRIKSIKPEKLFIAADGPRPHVPEDSKNCAEVKKVIDTLIDWPCEVNYLYRESNFGCGKAVSGAIDWFFSHVDEGIILEDDCLPDLSFFWFCKEMLEKYRLNKSVFHIAGLNWQDGKKVGEGDYYFSHYPGIWGWATWKNRWQHYQFDISSDSEAWKKVEQNLKLISNSYREQLHHLNTFRSCDSNKIDTWDFQWKFTVFLHLGLCIFPNQNLISNVGFGENATHTKGTDNWRANRSTVALPIHNLKHPETVSVNKKGDYYMARKLFTPSYLKITLVRLRGFVLRLFG